VQPVEINAGAWYLLPRNTAGWLADTCYAWAVCAATTGESVAHISLDPLTGTVRAAAHGGCPEAAVAAVRRFADAVTDRIVGRPLRE
jgi:hypothetical protein